MSNNISKSMQRFKYEYSVYMQYLEKCKII